MFKLFPTLDVLVQTMQGTLAQIHSSNLIHAARARSKKGCLTGCVATRQPVLVGLALVLQLSPLAISVKVLDEAMQHGTVKHGMAMNMTKLQVLHCLVT